MSPSHASGAPLVTSDRAARPTSPVLTAPRCVRPSFAACSQPCGAARSFALITVFLCQLLSVMKWMAFAVFTISLIIIAESSSALDAAVSAVAEVDDFADFAAVADVVAVGSAAVAVSAIDVAPGGATVEGVNDVGRRLHFRRDCVLTALSVLFIQLHKCLDVLIAHIQPSAASWPNR